MYRPTNGGLTWTSTNAGPGFQGPGRSNPSYFACMFNNGINMWRHMGWGEPAANGNVVSLDYAACGQPTYCANATDHGDIYYIRSTDAGLTWGTPVKLNTDSGTAMQWQPSLTATQNGALFASWYDQREVNGGADLNCTVGLSTQNCYRRWGRVSLDNGATWQPDDMVGRALSALPAQPDGAIQSTYEGDYDYHSSNGQTMIGGWTDGRVVISSHAQQDVFVNFVQGASPTASPTPTPSATASPTPTSTATPVLCSWSAGPNMPTVLIRAVGVYFPDGNFYTMGGRTSDLAGSDFQHVLRYSPGSNTWTQMGVTLPDNTMNNMACGVLSLGGTPYIYCVGGSAAGQTSATARVLYYDPATDSVVTLASGDNWPGDAEGPIKPGGFDET